MHPPLRHPSAAPESPDVFATAVAELQPPQQPLDARLDPLVCALRLANRVWCAVNVSAVRHG